MIEIKSMIQTILDSGISETELGKRVGASQSSINRLKTGVFTQCHYMVGKKIEGEYSRALARTKRQLAKAGNV